MGYQSSGDSVSKLMPRGAHKETANKILPATVSLVFRDAMPRLKNPCRFTLRATRTLMLPFHQSSRQVSANSASWQNLLTSFNWLMVLQGVSSSFGLATTIAKHCAREIATFSRLALNKNSMSRGMHSASDVAIETNTIGASWPWNLSTVPTLAPTSSNRRSD
jgi:hypothetical protein